MEFSKLMAEMSFAFRADLPEGAVDTYWKYLVDMSWFQVQSAMNQIIKTGDRFPSVAQIRTLAGSYREMKTKEISTAIQIEEFASNDCKPESADDFFKKVGSLFGEVKP